MRASLSCLALVAVLALLVGQAAAQTSCRAQYDNPTKMYSGALLSKKPVKPNTNGVDGENSCCFSCSSNSKCVYFTYYQKCSNNNKGCMGYCQLYGAAATSKTYNACHVDNGLGPLCYYQSGKKSSSG